MKLARVIGEFKGKNFFLSNFFMIGSWSVEHEFQASKTTNMTLQKLILYCEKPSIAKELGNAVRLRKDWNQIKDKIMEEALIKKFTTKATLARLPLKQMLLDTGDAILIEGNKWHDNYWGDCLCLRCKQIDAINRLGQLLMKVRNMLKNGEIE